MEGVEGKGTCEKQGKRGMGVEKTKNHINV